MQQFKFAQYLIAALLIAGGCSAVGNIAVKQGIKTIQGDGPNLRPLFAKRGEVSLRAISANEDSSFSYKVYDKEQSFSMVWNHVNEGAEDWDVAMGSATIKVKKDQALFALFDKDLMSMQASWEGGVENCQVEDGNMCLWQLVITKEIMTD